MERKFKPEKKETKPFRRRSASKMLWRMCVCFLTCKSCCTTLCDKRMRAEEHPQNTLRIERESPVGEQLKTLSERFENPLSTVPEVSIQLSENQRLPHRFSDSSFMFVFSDEESIFEDDIFFAGAFDVHSY